MPARITRLFIEVKAFQTYLWIFEDVGAQLELCAFERLEGGEVAPQSLRLCAYPVRRTSPISFSVRNLPVSVDFTLNRRFSKVTLDSPLIKNPVCIDGKSSHFSLTAFLLSEPHRCWEVELSSISFLSYSVRSSLYQWILSFSTPVS